jgi:hypothetical protein
VVPGARVRQGTVRTPAGTARPRDHALRSWRSWRKPARSSRPGKCKGSSAGIFFRSSAVRFELHHREYRHAAHEARFESDAAVPQPPIDGVVVEDSTRSFSFDLIGTDFDTGPFIYKDAYQGTMRTMVIRALHNTYDF